MLNTIVAAVAVASLAQHAQSFTITLDAPARQATPLFGPVREAEWAPDWHPAFIHPAAGGQRAGAVFTTAGRRTAQVWVVTEYDEEAGRVAYVVVEPGFLVTEIAIRVAADGSRRSRATVTYRRSALDPGANERVAALDAHWAETQSHHWGAAINAALKRAQKGD